MAETFRQIGEFPAQSHTRVRSTRNPLDKASIISIFPKKIIERKHTIEPGLFTINKGTVDTPSINLVGPSSWWALGRTENQPNIEIPVSAVQVAEAVIRDYCSGMLEVSIGKRMPGLIFIPGEVTELELKIKYKDALEKASIRQKDWFVSLVRIADALWARANGNPLVISDEMRLAATELSLEKPWMLEFNKVQLENCFACGTLKHPLYPVCPTCKAIDKNHPSAKDLQFAV